MNTKTLRQKILDLAIHGKLVRNEKKTFIAGSGYVRHLRIKLLEKLKPQLGKIKNIKTGIVANLSKKSVDKMTSAKALEKSKSNGFSVNEHFEIAEQIKPLYENAELAFEHGNLKNPKDPNVISIKRFVVGATLKSGTKADVLITVKESLANGNKIYSIEIDEINKASEKFGGLCDAAEKSADRATKTPHVDTSNIANLRKKSREDLDIGNEERESNVIASVAKQSIPKGKKRASLSGLTRQSVSEDEIPFELPKGWAWKRLGEICDLFNGDRGINYPSKKDYVQNGIPFINAGCLNNGVIDYSLANFITREKFNLLRAGKIKKGDILYCLRGSLGKTGIVRNDNLGAISSSLCIFRQKEFILSDYLLFILNSSLIKLQQRYVDNGTAQPNLSAKDVSNYLIPLPPLAEQKLIVAKIEKIFAQIDLLEQNKTDLQTAIKRAKSKILDLAIHGKLVPQNPSDEPASALLKRLATSDNRPYEKMEAPFAIPDSWAWCRLGEIYNHTTGKALKKSNDNGTLRKYITTSNLYWNSFDFKEVRSMYFTDEELEKCTIRKGDLVLCNGGDVGRAAIWNYDYDICYQNHVSRLRPKVEGISNKFFLYLLMIYKEKEMLNGKGVGITSLSAGDLLSTFFPLPPLAEQQRIVSKIETLFSELDKIQSNLV